MLISDVAVWQAGQSLPDYLVGWNCRGNSFIHSVAALAAVHTYIFRYAESINTMSNTPTVRLLTQRSYTKGKMR